MSNPFDVESFISDLTQDIDQTVAQAVPTDQEQAVVGTQETGPQVSDQVQAIDTDTNTIGGAGGNASADGGGGGDSFAIGGSAGDFSQEGKVNIAFDGNDGGDAASSGGAGGAGGLADASGGAATSVIEVDADQENDQINDLNQELDGDQENEVDVDADNDADNDVDNEQDLEDVDA
jgi:hypothetical protein